MTIAALALVCRTVWNILITSGSSSPMPFIDDIPPPNALIRAREALENIRETRWTFSDRPFAAFYAGDADFTPKKIIDMKPSCWRFVADTDDAWLDLATTQGLGFVSLSSGRYASSLCATISSVRKHNNDRPARLRFLEIPSIKVNAVWVARPGEDDLFHVDSFPLDRSALKVMAVDEFCSFVAVKHREMLAAYARAGGGADLCG